MSGGADNDSYVVDAAGDQVLENANAGTDTVQTTLASLRSGANVENLTFTDGATHTGFGNALANVMTGGTGQRHVGGTYASRRFSPRNKTPCPAATATTRFTVKRRTS